MKQKKKNSVCINLVSNNSIRKINLEMKHRKGRHQSTHKPKTLGNILPSKSSSTLGNDAKRVTVIFLTQTHTNDTTEYSYITHFKHYFKSQQALIMANFPILQPVKAIAEAEIKSRYQENDKFFLS